jgi:hypothetical protein
VINEERVEKAVEFLRDTAEIYGRARGFVAFCEGNLRRVKALAMTGKAGSLGDREAAAYSSQEYFAAMEAHQNAVAESETIRAKREAASMTIEVWRSQNSSRKAGMV